VKIEAVKSAAVPLVEGPGIVSVSDRRVGPNLVWQQAVGALPALELGQELDALVVKELDGGRLLLELGATLIEADSPGELGAGQHIRLRVGQLQPQVVLHVTNVEPAIESEAARLVRSHLPTHADFGELMDSLQSTLATLLERPDGVTPQPERLAKLREFIGTFLARDTPLSAEKVELLARDGGLFYETKLLSAAANGGEQLVQIADHDLKGLLLAALRESPASAFSTGLQNALSGQLENLEMQQAVNLLAQLDGAVVQMQIPFFDGARFSTAALAVAADGAGREEQSSDGKSAYSLLVMLDLENFGRTRIDAHIRTNELRALFFVDHEHSLQLIRQELPGFREMLINHGYREVLLAAKSLSELPPDKEEKFAALLAGAPLSIHLLDMKA
jgi:hypothetical protein